MVAVRVTQQMCAMHSPLPPFTKVIIGSLWGYKDPAHENSRKYARPGAVR